MSIFPPLIYMGLIFMMSSIPGGRRTDGMLFFLEPRISNVLHIPAYGLLFILWYGYFAKRSARPGLYSFTIATGCGILNELFQLFIPNRYPSVLDILFNTTGVALGFLALRVRKRLSV